MCPQPRLLMQNTMQMTAEKQKMPVNNDCTGKGSPPPPTLKIARKNTTSHHKNLLWKQQGPSLLLIILEKQSTHRGEERVSVRALVGEMTYPFLSALVDGPGEGTVTVPTLSSPIWMVVPKVLLRYLLLMLRSRSARRVTAMSSGLSRWRVTPPFSPSSSGCSSSPVLADVDFVSGLCS